MTLLDSIKRLLAPLIKILVSDTPDPTDPPDHCPHCGCPTQQSALMKDGAGEPVASAWSCGYCGTGSGDREPRRGVEAARQRLRSDQVLAARVLEDRD